MHIRKTPENIYPKNLSALHEVGIAELFIFPQLQSGSHLGFIPVSDH